MGMKASSGFFHGTNGDLKFKLDIQFFASSKTELFSSTGHVSERSISKNREYFYGKSASEIANALNEQGYETTIRPSKHATSKAKAIVVGNSDKHRNITQILVSPGTPRHGNVPYVKISTNNGGRFKVVDGTKSEYKTDGNENAKTVFSEEKVMNKMLIPYKGIGRYQLYQTVEETISMLQEDGDSFVEELWSNEDLTNPVPWTIIRTASGMNMFFAKNRMFKIYVEGDFPGTLPNGIEIGTKMSDVVKMDPNIKYDDWEEDWQSPEGYWLEDDPSNDTVMTITIFIKELVNDELFEQYNW